MGQDRTLTNAGLRSDVSYVKGIHNMKVGSHLSSRPSWTRNDSSGSSIRRSSPRLTDANGNLLLWTRNGNRHRMPLAQTLAPLRPDPRQAALFTFNGHTDVKELALYVQDTITKGNWSFNLGLRGDIYNGLTTHKEAEPRLGIAYNIKPTNTVLRVSYARMLETPFNENLVLSSLDAAILC